MRKALLSERTKWIAGKTDRDERTKWLPLWMHLKDTAAVMENLLNAYIPEGTLIYLAGGHTKEALRKLCIFLGAAHDIGKATAVFQNFLYPGLPQDWRAKAEQTGFPAKVLNLTEPRQPRHQTASAVILENMGCPAAIVEIIGAHHGTPREENHSNKAGYQLDMLYRNYYGDGTEYEQAERELTDFALREASVSDFSELMVPGQGSGMLLSGFLIMADWIASNTYYFPLIGVNDSSGDAVYPERIERGLGRLKLPDIWRPLKSDSIETLCRSRFSFSPNEIQQAVCEAAMEMEVPGIVILEAQMGKGKTEASLLGSEILAEKTGRGGLFFGLPTQATANGIFPRIVGWADTQAEQGLLSIRLVHGTAQFNELFVSLAGDVGADDHSGLVVHDWFKGSKQALLSDYVIGTVDQVLLASLMRKHVMLRHIGLADKVIIIDECHAYDAYMNVYLVRTLSWLGLYHVPVIILSATLPCATRSKLIDAYLNRRKAPDPGAEWRTTEAYPLLTWTDGGTVCQKTIPLLDEPKTVWIHETTDDQRIAILQEKLVQGGCAGVICNTVARAQTLYAELGTVFPGEVLLFHARFLTEDRASIERELLHFLGKPGKHTQRPQRLIVIGTQVMEQSLDVDLDLLITDLCPMDLLLQRIGRLHRHKGRQRPEAVRIPECWICGMEEQAMVTASLIYEDYLLKRTHMLLRETISLPGDIAGLVQATYRESDIPPELSDAFERLQHHRAESERKAKCYCLPAPNPKADARKTLRGLLDVQAEGTESEAQASVRDIEESIDVLVLVEYPDGVGLVPWHEPGKRFSLSDLTDDEARRIGRERIGLPQSLCGKRYEQTIAELKKMGERFLLWRRNPALSYAEFLVLSPELETDLSGYHLRYLQKEGLICEREGGK
ncbi:MAG: CRISPR-associated helicase Cas3' [Clostridia bacterium]|nr:CRISPR-associated helicase Cas3' [Clostridia bacterium]